MFICFDLIQERDRQTDGQTPRAGIYRAYAYASRGKNYDNMLSRFHLIPERDGWTDRQNCHINIVRQCADT